MRPYTARVMRHRERQDTIRQELKGALLELRRVRRERQKYADAWRELAEAHGQVDSGGVIFQMEGEPTLLALTPSDATLGNPAWAAWQAEVAAGPQTARKRGDALADEAWAETDVNQHTQQGD